MAKGWKIWLKITTDQSIFLFLSRGLKRKFSPHFSVVQIVIFKRRGTELSNGCQRTAFDGVSISTLPSLPFPATQGMSYKNSAINSLHFSPRKSREEAFFESFRLVLGRCVEQSNLLVYTWHHHWLKHARIVPDKNRIRFSFCLLTCSILLLVFAPYELFSGEFVSGSIGNVILHRIFCFSDFFGGILSFLLSNFMLNILFKMGIFRWLRILLDM